MLNPMFVALLLVAQPEAEAMEASATSVAAAQEDADDELICRRRQVDSGRIGERNRSVRVCKTREEWEADRRGRRAG